MNQVTTSRRVVVHENPVWRDRSTTMIRALVPEPPGGERWYEQLWGRRIDDQHYELCCIPFATYDYALGDIVEVGIGDYTVTRVAERSGRGVLRVWLADASRDTWDELQGLLRFRGLLFEFRKPALVAIDVPDENAAKDVEAELRTFELAGKLRYERGSSGYTPAPES